MMDLRALVTGASSGIGAAFCRALRGRGERLIVVARRAARLSSLAGELGGPAAVAVIPLDLAEPGAGARLQQEIEARGLAVDLLVNNAGFGETGRLLELPLERGLQMIDLNARVVMELTRRFVPAMVGRGRGAVINVVSTSAFQPVPFLTLYAATKSFALSFTEGLATELKGSGVRVQALCPGYTETEFFEASHTDPRLLVNRAPRMSAEAVVARSLQALDRGRLRVIPGLANRVTATLARLAPPALARAVAAALYRPR